MATPVEMPKLGNTVDECRISTWHARKGEHIASGDVLAEIETDKTNFELTAPVSGTVLELFFAEGAFVPVFVNLCVIGAPGESAEPFRPPTTASAPADRAARNVAPALEPETTPRGDAATRSPAPGGPPVSGGVLSPRARRFAAEHDFDPGPVSGSGPGGRVLEEDVRKLYFSRPRATPAARRRMAEGSLLRGGGTGAGGMIRVLDLGPAPTPLSGTRERIAGRMRDSLASTAQYTLHASANAAGLLAVRKMVKASRDLPDININDLMIFCTIKALLRMPELNAEFIEGRLFRHADINIGFACDTERGLVVPVVRESQTLALGELSLKLKQLAAQAVRGTIGADDLSGGTFTVSNLGSLGIESFTPLLNPPQVAILGVGAIRVDPVRNAAGGVEFIDAIVLSLTCDHQVVDGAPGARFLKILREMVEGVESLCTI